MFKIKNQIYVYSDLKKKKKNEKTEHEKKNNTTEKKKTRGNVPRASPVSDR
jgi:hypothetical protein